MNVQIVYPHEKYFASFHEALSSVARERIYIEMIEAPPLEKVAGFQKGLIDKNGPVYYAIDNDRVIVSRPSSLCLHQFQSLRTQRFLASG